MTQHVLQGLYGAYMAYMVYIFTFPFPVFSASSIKSKPPDTEVGFLDPRVGYGYDLSSLWSTP